jgi:hypothetical protein
VSTVRCGIRRACGEVPGRNQWGNPMMNRSAKGGARSSLRDEDEGILALPPESVSHNRAYFVVVVVAVEKWEAAFCFPLFHGLLRLSARSACQCFWVERRVLFKLHRADIVQRRVHSCLVIPEQPVQGLILGLA